MSQPPSSEDYIRQDQSFRHIVDVMNEHGGALSITPQTTEDTGRVWFVACAYGADTATAGEVRLVDALVSVAKRMGYQP